jgi:hypothetical protein
MTDDMTDEEALVAAMLLGFEWHPLDNPLTSAGLFSGSSGNYMGAAPTKREGVRYFLEFKGILKKP